MQTLDAPHPIQRHVLPGRVLASRGTGPGMRLGWSGMTLAIDGRADVQKGCHVLRGGGPVACVMPVVTEFVTLLAATATQFARAGRLWTLWTIEIEVAVRLGWSGMALAIDDPP